MKTAQDKKEFNSTYNQLPTILNKTNDLLQLTDIIDIFQYEEIESLNQLQNELKNQILESNWRFYYLDYDKLFKSYQSLLDPFFMTNQQHDQQDEFYKLYQQELMKVKEFYIVKCGEMERRLNHLSTITNEEEMELLNQDIIYDIIFDIQSLWYFIKLNYKLFLIFIYQLDLYYKKDDHHKNEATMNHLFIQKLYLLITSHPMIQLNQFLNWISILNKYNHIILPTSSPSSSSSISSSSSTTSIHTETEEIKKKENQFIHPIPVPSTRTNHSSIYINSLTESFYTTMNTFHTSLTNNNDTNDNNDNIDDDEKYISSTAYHSLDNDHHFFHHYQQNENHSTCKQLKYWIHPDNILDIILYLSKYMTIDNNNNNTSLLPLSEFEIDEGKWDHQQSNIKKKNYIQSIQTIYLDTNDFNNYHSIINNSSSTSLLRLRNYYYEDNEKEKVEKDSIFALENKIYQSTSSFINESSFIKNRVWIKLNRFQSWIQHQWTLSHLLMKTYNLDYYKINQEHLSKLSSTMINKNMVDQQIMEMESLLHSTNQIPVMTSHSDRIIFKKEENNYKIVIQIDTNIKMEPYENKKNNHISRFPYGILKINIYHHDHYDNVLSNIPWLYDFVNCALMEQVNDFSVYLHGVSTLFTHKIKGIPSSNKKLSLDLSKRTQQTNNLLGDIDYLNLLQKQNEKKKLNNINSNNTNTLNQNQNHSRHRSSSSSSSSSSSTSSSSSLMTTRSMIPELLLLSSDNNIMISSSKNKPINPSQTMITYSSMTTNPTITKHDPKELLSSSLPIHSYNNEKSKKRKNQSLKPNNYTTFQYQSSSSLLPSNSSSSSSISSIYQSKIPSYSLSSIKSLSLLPSIHQKQQQKQQDEIIIDIPNHTIITTKDSKKNEKKNIKPILLTSFTIISSFFVAYLFYLFIDFI